MFFVVFCAADPVGELNATALAVAELYGGAYQYSRTTDALLREAVASCGPKRWRDIASMMASRRKYRTHDDCHARWITLTNHGKTPEKRKWTVEEDASLVALVEQYEFKNWALIASELPGRSAKQCRERWQNQVRPDLNHGPWTPQEDAVIVAWQRSVGNKWATIAEKLVGRTDNMVKNHWHSTLAREAPPAAAASSVQNDTRAHKAVAVVKPKSGAKPPRARTKSRKRKRVSSSGSKKKKKKKKKSASRSTETRPAIQVPKDLASSPPPKPAGAFDSPDTIDAAVTTWSLAVVESAEDCQAEDEDGGKLDMSDLPGAWCELRPLKDEPCDEWLHEGFADTHFLTDLMSWGRADGMKLSSQDDEDDDEVESVGGMFETQCLPSGTDEFECEL